MGTHRHTRRGGAWERRLLPLYLLFLLTAPFVVALLFAFKGHLKTAFLLALGNAYPAVKLLLSILPRTR